MLSTKAFRLIAGLAAGMAFAVPPAQSAEPAPRSHRPVRADTSPPLRDLLQDYRAESPRGAGETHKPREVPNRMVPDFLRGTVQREPALDPTAQLAPSQTRAPAANISFEGFSNADNIAVAGGQVAPADPNGDVGLLHYIQYINVGWTIFNKSDGSVFAGPFAGNTFWTGFGGICESDNAGDPIVLYDEIADRWIFSQFADPVSAGGTQCFAISATADPLGPYHRYEYSIPGIDYPKIGIFTDGADHSGFYLTTNNFANAGPSFSGVSAIAADRDAMLAGNASPVFIEFSITDVGADGFFAVMPGHLEGSDVPPGGTCNVLVQAFDDDIFGGGTRPTDGYMLWEFCPDFDTPASSTLSAPTFVDAGVDFDSELCGFGACAPQPGTAQQLDTASQFTMYRAAMRYAPQSAPGQLRMVLSHTVDVGANRAGLRWAEFNVSGITSTVVDQGTFAPGDEHRFFPSIAMDVSGNIGVGYTVSASDQEPSVYFTGREVGDAAGQLQAEEVCVDSAGVQTGTNRWNDYTSMSVDPVDQCTFWYTSQYMPATSSLGWSTRVCSFTFPDCGVDRVLLTPSAGQTDVLACTGDSINPITIDVTTSTGDTSDVTMGSTDLPGTFSLVYNTNPVTPPGQTTASIDVGLSATAGEYDFTLTGTSANVGLAVGTLPISVTVFENAPVAPTLEGPAAGLFDLGQSPEFSWAAVPDAFDYTLEIATDAGFNNIVDAVVTVNTSAEPSADLAANTQFFWRVIASNACGDSVASDVRSFSTAALAQSLVLLVDDDDNSPDTSSINAQMLTDLGLSFDVVNTGSSDVGEPTAAEMSNYLAVYWFTGDAFNAGTGPGTASESEIQTYVSGGGCFVLNSQDYAFKALSFDTTATPFMTDVFGVTEVQHDVNHDNVTGENLFAALGPYALDYAGAGIGSAPAGYNDTFSGLDAAAQSLFLGDSSSDPGSAAATRDVGSGHAMWSAFALEALPGPQARAEVLGEFLIDRCNLLDGIAIGELSGTVTLALTGTPAAGAVVSASRGGVTVAAVADANGDYAFPALTPGFYQVEVSLPNAATATATNVEIQDASVTDQDFVLDAGQLAFDTSTLTETLPPDDTVGNALGFSNVGNLPIDVDLSIGGYASGLPAASVPPLDPRFAGRRSSYGRAALLQSPRRNPGPVVPRAPGDYVLAAPIPINNGSPLGITAGPSGDIWVSDLEQGLTARFDANLGPVEVINDPIGIPLIVTSGVAYDSLNNTLWWLDYFFETLVEGNLDGTPTGNTIQLPVPAGQPFGDPAGVEYDAARDAFVYLDIGLDDIFAVDRSGTLLPGFPVPQTAYDDGSGLLGNGLDVVDGDLEVLVGTETNTDGDIIDARAVLTDPNGNDRGTETDLSAIPDGFPNDIARSRTMPNERLYVAGNATNSVYVVEPANFILARRWASTDVDQVSLAAGASQDVQLTYDSTGLPAGFYQALLSTMGNYANAVPPKGLGLSVEGASGIVVEITGYIGADGGAGCGSTDGSVVLGFAGQAATLCLTVRNTGSVTLDGVAGTLSGLGINFSQFVRQTGALPILPGAEWSGYFTTSVPANRVEASFDLSAQTLNEFGQPTPPGSVQSSGSIVLDIFVDGIFYDGFEAQP